MISKTVYTIKLYGGNRLMMHYLSYHPLKKNVFFLRFALLKIDQSIYKISRKGKLTSKTISKCTSKSKGRNCQFTPCWSYC